VPIGVPNFFIEKFRIPPFLLPIYQAAGMQYGVRWEILAAINEIETDYGRNLNVSSAGALGWMQFMPATWKAYGVDANHDRAKDPYNPVDAIFAAARYLRAAGIDKDLRKGIFAYNHADWYVDSVLMRARVIGGLPADLVGSLTGLTQGRFPVDAKATYEGEVTRRESRRQLRQGNAAYVVEGSGRRRSIPIYSRAGADVVAVTDGRVARIGHSDRLGRYVQLEDVYGNTYTYARLGKVAETYLAPKAGRTSRRAVARELELPRDPRPTRAASAGSNRGATATRTPAAAPRKPAAPAAAPEGSAAAPEGTAAPTKERLFAHPSRPNSAKAGGAEQLGRSEHASGESTGNYTERPLKKGARVTGGTVLGRVGRPAEGDAETKPYLLFEIRPAGRGAPRIDPKPILDGWKLLESTAVYRAANRNPFFGPDAENPTIGQILLMSKATLERHVLSNPRIEIYECGRRDIRTGQIDRRVLATLEYLAASGLRPTVTSMRCGHGHLTASGNVSEHSSGDAVDIAAINGIPILGNQGKGSITETTIKRLLTLQGTLKPHQIISLMTFEGADNTLAMGDHADHIHVGWHAVYDRDDHGRREIDAVLKPRQWLKLIDRLDEIDNPRVRLTPSQYAVRTVKRPSGD
jgi:murein DD-endopeptidase MepM/ murein hydrolase activator NlpD